MNMFHLPGQIKMWPHLRGYIPSRKFQACFFAPDNPDAPKRCRKVCHQVGLDQKTWKKKRRCFRPNDETLHLRWCNTISMSSAHILLLLSSYWTIPVVWITKKKRDQMPSLFPQLLRLFPLSFTQKVVPPSSKFVPRFTHLTSSIYLQWTWKYVPPQL